MTDKGPQRQWLKEMRKVDDLSSIYRCPCIGDKVGRSREQAEADEHWCGEGGEILVVDRQ